MQRLSRALLIGIDIYDPHELADGGTYPNLTGAVNDAQAVASHLQKQWSVPHLELLTSPPQPEGKKPTYSYMVAAIKDMIEKSDPGDHVWLHYSGHGARTATLIPETKGRQGLDEALVPCDVGSKEGTYLRDLELAFMLEKAAQKEVFVTLVLDCCHSGGMVREGTPEPPPTAVARSRGCIDNDPPRRESLVAHPHELAELWLQQEQSAKRGLAQKGWVILSACHHYEKAYEDFFDGHQKHGALTWFLLNALKDKVPKGAYYHCYQGVVARVHQQYPAQTPKLEGEIAREFLGTSTVFLKPGLMLLKHNEDKVLINGGAACGIKPGMHLQAFSNGTSWPSKPLADLCVIREDGVYAEAVLNQKNGEMGPGDLVLPTSRGSHPLRVTWDSTNIAHEPWSRAVEAAIALEGCVIFAPEGRIRLRVDQAGMVQMFFSERPIILPELMLNSETGVARVVASLNHLAWFDHAWSLSGGDKYERLKHKVGIKCLRGWEPTSSTWDIQKQLMQEPYTCAPGSKVTLLIRNESRYEVHCTLLCLSQDGSVTRLVPGAGIPGDFSLARGESFSYPLTTFLEPGHTHTVDRFKLLVTSASTDASWLELPPLGAASEQGLSMVQARDTPGRELKVLRHRFWQIHNLDLMVRRSL